MNINLITEKSQMSALGDLGYVVVKIPDIGTFVTINGESPDKVYEIVLVTITCDENGMSGIARLMALDAEGEDLGEETQDVNISHLSVH